MSATMVRMFERLGHSLVSVFPVLAVLVCLFLLSGPALAHESEDGDSLEDRQAAFVFGILDRNGDGTVSPREAKSGAYRKFSRMDADRNKEITMDELVAYAIKVQKKSKNKPSAAAQWAMMQSLRVLLARSDKDKDGKISQDEFARFVGRHYLVEYGNR